MSAPEQIRIGVTAQIKPAPRQATSVFWIITKLPRFSKEEPHCCLGSSQSCLGKLHGPGHCFHGVPRKRCAAPKPRALPPNAGRDPPPSGCLLFGPCRKAGARLVAAAQGGGGGGGGGWRTAVRRLHSDPTTGPNAPPSRDAVHQPQRQGQGTGCRVGPARPMGLSGLSTQTRLRCQAAGPQEETWAPKPTFAWSQRKSAIFKGMR